MDQRHLPRLAPRAHLAILLPPGVIRFGRGRLWLLGLGLAASYRLRWNRTCNLLPTHRPTAIANLQAPAEQKLLLDSYRKSRGDNGPPEDVFTTQVRFEEDSHEYWILVQKPLLDALPKELSRGQALEAYVMWIGAIKVGKRWEWLFAMNEFEASQKPATVH